MTNKAIRKLLASVLALLLLAGSSAIVSVSAEENGKAVVTCGGKTYEAAIGEEVVYTARLTVPGRTEEVSGFITYDTNVLTLVDESYVECLPNMNDAILNTYTKGEVYFNSFSAYGYNFEDNQVLITLRFTVTGTGDCEIKSELTSLCGPNNEKYVYDGIITDDNVYFSESLGNDPEARFLEIEHDGETYTANVGDEITYTAYLTAPERITEVMAGIEFSYKYLYLEEAKPQENFPNIFDAGNDYAGGSLQFAGTVIGEGFYPESEVLAQLTFKVTAEGKTSINVFYELFGDSGNCYMTEAGDGVTVTSVITPVGEATDDTAKEILGDSNGNGLVNVKDATQIQKATAKLLELDTAAQLRADVNKDEKINIKDATAIQKYVAKIETGLAIGEPLA